MTKFINIARYIIAIALPLFLLKWPIAAALVSFAVLWLNNYLDDILFYLGSKEVKNHDNQRGLFLSPVNGIVTLIEKGVQTDMITKRDVLEIPSPSGKPFVIQSVNPSQEKRERYDHVAVYLNKFNKHVVLNPSSVVSVSRHWSDGNVEMVSCDDLVADNVGEYLNNDALIVEYKDFFMVLTMDKFISKYILGEDGSAVCCLICRGSQCDFFFKENTCIYPNVGECIDIYDNLAGVRDATLSYTVEKEIESMVGSAIEDAGGYVGMIWSSLWKSMQTFSSLSMFVAVFILPLLFSATPLYILFSYVAFSSLYLFLFVRSYRHLMYAVMNVTGFKEWMQKSYMFINKVSLLWKK